jgi:membrane fusion protein (multidrug efflux system)
VTANFKETQLKHMSPGQKVTFEVDGIGGREYTGHVDSLQSGTGAAFSILPPENATGNYVKIVQRIPVKIVIDSGNEDHRLVPGMSVVPSVRVR